MKKKHFLLLLPILFFTMMPSLFASEPFLMINEDNDHYFKLSPELMTKEGLEAYIDQFAGTKVTHFLMCPNGQRTSYRSAVHESIWDNIDRYKEPNIWSRNCKTLFERGIDPYKVWIDRCREKGIVPWLTMRMNDVHYTPVPNYFRNTDHWRNHPQWWRIPNSTSWHWSDYAYNYSLREVREYHFALVRELLDRYDIDGFEMDWLRNEFNLTPGKEQEETHFLTEFVRDVRNLVKETSKKRGHAITVSVRVPADPQAATSVGLDVVTWARNGLVDCIIAGNHWFTTDHAICVQTWKKAIGHQADQIRIIPATDNGCCAWYNSERLDIDPAIISGWANEMHWLGADSFYLFNLIYLPIEKPQWREILEKGLSLDAVQLRPQRHVIGWRDFGINGEGQFVQLPKNTDKETSITIQIGHKPTRGQAVFVMALQKKEKNTETAFEITINGTVLKESINPDLPQYYYGDQAGRIAQFTIPLSSLNDGENSVRIRQTKGTPQTIIWAELDSF